MSDRTFYRRVVALVAAALLGVVVVWVLEPLAPALVWAVLLGCLLSPLHKRLTARFKGRKGRAALALTAAVLFVVALPLGLFGAVFMRQAMELSRVAAGAIGRAHTGEAPLLPWSTDVIAWVRDVLHVQPAALYARVAQSLAMGLEFIVGRLGTVFVGAVDAVASFALTLFVLYFVLRDGERITEDGLVFVPEGNEASARHLLSHMASVARAVVVGTLVTAAVQGALVGVALAITKLPFAVVFGVIAALLSVLPVGGTALVWGPASVVLMFQGRYGAAIFLLAWGVLVVSAVDNIIRPRLVSGRAHVSTLASFLGIVGGIAAFGLVGLFLGPMVLSLAVELLRMVREKRKVDART